MNSKAAAQLLILVVAVLAVARGAEGATCNPVQLAPCAMSITTSTPPSSACCNALMGQRACLCQYYRDPTLSRYVNSPGAKMVATTCRVTVKC